MAGSGVALSYSSAAASWDGCVAPGVEDSDLSRSGSRHAVDVPENVL